MNRFPPHLNEGCNEVADTRLAAAENNARISRDDPPKSKMMDWYCQAGAVSSVRELLQAGHAQQALLELKEAIPLVPTDSEWYEPMVSAANLIEAGRVLDTKVKLHQAVARFNPNSLSKGRW